MKVRITRKFEVARNISAFELADPVGASLPAFSAGAHIDVHLGHGLIRQYSLCNSPGEQHRYLIGVLLEPASRGGSTAMHGLPEGTLIEIGEPKNHFPLSHDATHSILLAGGIGVTPILSMAERLAHTGASFELHYCTREPERAAFRELCNIGLQDTLRIHHKEDQLFTWWDYQMRAFEKNRGLRIDAILASEELAKKCIAAGVDREMRRGKDPSDHAPVWAEFRM